MKTLLSLVTALTLLALSPALAEKFAPGEQIEQSFKVSDKQSVPYLLYLPKGIEKPGKQWPLILFLHGRGESHGPLSIVAKWGPPRMAARGDDLPYIVVSPQCPKESRWTADEQQDGVSKLLDHIVEKFPVDNTRIYLTGLSMGGYGSWKLAASHPKRFAAAAIICGAGDPADAPKLVDLPIWVWHGTEDRTVPYKRSVEMVEAIEKAGGKKIRFTTLKHVDHLSWCAAYASPDLYSWFDKQRAK